MKIEIYWNWLEKGRKYAKQKRLLCLGVNSCNISGYGSNLTPHNLTIFSVDPRQQKKETRVIWKAASQ